MKDALKRGGSLMADWQHNYKTLFTSRENIKPGILYGAVRATYLYHDMLLFISYRRFPEML